MICFDAYFWREEKSIGDDFDSHLESHEDDKNAIDQKRPGAEEMKREGLVIQLNPGLAFFKDYHYFSHQVGLSYRRNFLTKK